MLCSLQAAGGLKRRCFGEIKPPASTSTLLKPHTSSTRPAAATSSAPLRSKQPLPGPARFWQHFSGDAAWCPEGREQARDTPGLWPRSIGSRGQGSAWVPSTAAAVWSCAMNCWGKTQARLLAEQLLAPGTAGPGTGQPASPSAG